MFLVNALQVLCGRTVIEVLSRPRSLKFVYVRGSRDLARQALLFRCHFLLSFFVPPISLFLQFSLLCDQEQRLRRRLVQCLFSFLATFLCVLGQFSTQCKEMAKAFPRSIYLARGQFCEKHLFKRLVVCRKCKQVYPF